MSDIVTKAAEPFTREPQQYKRDLVENLRQMLEQTPDAVFADYSGLDVSAMTELRRALEAQDSTLRVVKNRFLRIALSSMQLPIADEFLIGPTVLATLGDEPGAACKVLIDVRADSTLKIKGALVDGQIIDAAQVEALASLPSRELLYAMLLSAMNGPARSLAGVLQGVIRKLMATVQAIADQADAGHAAAEQGGAINESDE